MVKSREVRKLDLDLKQCAIYQVGNKLRQLRWVQHFGDFDIRFSESGECFPALLHVSDFEKEWQLFALAHLIATNLLEKYSEQIFALSELELNRLPVVSDKEALHPGKSIDEDTS